MERVPSQELSEGAAGKSVCVGYIRVSGTDQLTHGQGLPIQRQQIVDHCRRQNLPLIEIYEDAAISGTEISTRPGLLRLLEDAKTKTFNSVVCSKIDRLSRNTLWTLWIEKELRKYGVSIYSISEPYRWEDPSQKIFLTIISAFAEFERHRISDRLASGRRRKWSMGRFPGNGVAYGYKTNSDGELIVVPEEAAIIQEVFRLRKHRKSLTEIAAILNQKGVPTKRGKRFYASTIRYILRNTTYRGFVKYKTQQKGIHEPIRRPGP